MKTELLAILAAQHTPTETPFHITAMPAPRGKDYGSNIYNARGSYIATVPNDFTQHGASNALEAAAFIVRACNSHAELLAALQALVADAEAQFKCGNVPAQISRQSVESLKRAIASATA